MRAMALISWSAFTLAVVTGCSGEGTATGVLAHLLELGTFRFGPLPPTWSRCGRFQPGYDDGDPMADPAIPATLPGRIAGPCAVDADCHDGLEPAHVCQEGQCRQVYDPFADGFCTIQFTTRFEERDGVVHLLDDLYVIEMGQVDPDAALSAGAMHVQQQLAMGAEVVHYCHFDYAVEAEPVGAHPQEDVQLLRQTLVEDASGFCPSYTQGRPVEQLAIRSTDPDIVIWAGDSDDVERAAGGVVAFRGYLGVEGTGGASLLTHVDRGWMGFLRACTPEPTAEGPGVCPATCRIASPNADGTLPTCTWEDVRALPANPCHIDSAWRDAYPHLYDEVVEGQCD